MINEGEDQGNNLVLKNREYLCGSRLRIADSGWVQKTTEKCHNPVVWYLPRQNKRVYRFRKGCGRMVHISPVFCCCYCLSCILPKPRATSFKIMPADYEIARRVEEMFLDKPTPKFNPDQHRPQQIRGYGRFSQWGMGSTVHNKIVI